MAGGVHQRQLSEIGAGPNARDGGASKDAPSVALM